MTDLILIFQCSSVCFFFNSVLDGTGSFLKFGQSLLTLLLAIEKNIKYRCCRAFSELPGFVIKIKEEHRITVKKLQIVFIFQKILDMFHV